MGMEIAAYVKVRPNRFAFAPRNKFGQLTIMDDEFPAFRFTRAVRRLLNHYIGGFDFSEDIEITKEQARDFYNAIKDESVVKTELLFNIRQQEFKDLKEFFRVAVENDYYIMGG